MLDLALVTVNHLWLFGAAFTIVVLLIRLLMIATPLRLRRVPGTAIYFAGVTVVAVTAVLAAVVLPDPRLATGLLATALLVMLFGVLDERYCLPPLRQLLAQVTIAVTAVASGWVITHVSDPVGTGVFQLTGVNSLMTVVALTATVAWLILLMNAMNWIDGSDGLAGGVGFIALASLALISLLPQTQDPITFSLAVIGAGSIAGFLIWNAPPARVYLGTVGSWWLGLYIGLVAIIGGGKVATALLVLALPVIDASWVIVQRALARQSLWRGDTRHLHHRLLAAGYSPRIVFSGALTLSGALGLAAVTLQTQHKLIALVIAGGMIVLGSIYLILRNHHASS